MSKFDHENGRKAPGRWRRENYLQMAQQRGRFRQRSDFIGNRRGKRPLCPRRPGQALLLYAAHADELRTSRRNPSRSANKTRCWRSRSWSLERGAQWLSTWYGWSCYPVIDGRPVAAAVTAAVAAAAGERFAKRFVLVSKGTLKPRSRVDSRSARRSSIVGKSPTPMRCSGLAR